MRKGQKKTKLVAIAAINPDDFKDIKQRVEVINRELGEVAGEMRGVRGQIAMLQWLVGGTLLAAVASFVLRMLGIGG